jgi:hypothetical protein
VNAALRFRLNVFSNVASTRVADNFSARAIRSFEKTFGVRCDRDFSVGFYVDPNPNPELVHNWVDQTVSDLAGRAIDVTFTAGLADGYLQSVCDADADYMVQLEHDFVFKRQVIHHSLDELTHCMSDLGADYLRFNKRWNRASGTDAFMEPEANSSVPVCWSNSRSNNPHIIACKAYREVWLPLSQEVGGAMLEGGVCRYLGGGLVYGGLGMPASVGHLDGRSVRLKDVLLRNFQP